MVERWISFYGLEAARAICRHGQSQPALTLRLASPEVEAELTAAGIVLEAGELLTAARTVVSGDVDRDCGLPRGPRALSGRRLATGGRAGRLSRESQPKSKKHPRCLRGARRKDADPCRAQSAGPHRRLRIQRAATGAVAQAACASRQTASNAAWPMQPRSPKTRPSILCWPTCLAAEPARWAATRRFATGCAPRICTPGRTAAGDSQRRTARRPPRRPRRLLHLLAGAGRKRAGCRRGARRNSECPPGFAWDSHRRTARRGNSYGRRRGAAAWFAYAGGYLRLLPGAFHTDGFFIC